MKKFSAACLIFFAICLIAEEPIMRIGIMTDTHVKQKIESCNLLKEALALFKMHKVDMIANVGDIADVYNEKAYKNYRDTVKKVFPDEKLKPREIFVYANHDVIGRKKESPFEVFKDVKKHLEIANDPYDVIKFKGYTFLVIPQFMDRAKYIAMLDKAVKENPDKPIFVFDHVPALNTVYNSGTWGNDRRRQILDKYPQAIQISGHVHGTLTNELNIWQGNFTAVNAGGLARWHGIVTGGTPEVMYSDMALIMEVFPKKVVFRRFFTKTKQEYSADNPWSIPIPFAKATAPYNVERRKAASVAPEFSAGASVTVKQNKDKVVFTFPAAVHKDDVYNYRIELLRKANGVWQKHARLDKFGKFMLAENKRPTKLKHTFSIGYFDAGCDYKITIVPVNFFGKAGKAVSKEFSIKEKVSPTVVYESRNPAVDCKFMNGLSGGTQFKKDENGFFIHDRFEGRLVFPENVWAGKRGTHFRFTVEMQTVQNGDKNWTVVLRNPTPLRNANHRIVTPSGDSGNLRYVIDFRKANDKFNYYLLIREGRKGKVKFNYIKIEKLN